MAGCEGGVPLTGQPPLLQQRFQTAGALAAGDDPWRGHGSRLLLLLLLCPWFGIAAASTLPIGPGCIAAAATAAAGVATTTATAAAAVVVVVVVVVVVRSVDTAAVPVLVGSGAIAATGTTTATTAAIAIEAATAPTIVLPATE